MGFTSIALLVNATTTKKNATTSANDDETNVGQTCGIIITSSMATADGRSRGGQQGDVAGNTSGVRKFGDKVVRLPAERRALGQWISSLSWRQRSKRPQFLDVIRLVSSAEVLTAGLALQSHLASATRTHRGSKTLLRRGGSKRADPTTTAPASRERHTAELEDGSLFDDLLGSAPGYRLNAGGVGSGVTVSRKRPLCLS